MADEKDVARSAGSSKKTAAPRKNAKAAPRNEAKGSVDGSGQSQPSQNVETGNQEIIKTVSKEEKKMTQEALGMVETRGLT
ncbi:MAG: microcompartment protein, partial [Lachnospiraceae bacterium]|nr:microcompartment protein [Lachnospiraceae bacterium]